MPGGSEEFQKLLQHSSSYGTTSNEEEEAKDQFDASSAFHLGVNKVIASNVWASKRFSQSFVDYGDEYEPVPTLLKDNVAIQLDSSLDPRYPGKLYYAKCAFYNTDEEPHYLLTVNPDVYQRIMKEVIDSDFPCGLYFCCHGGEGAHTGISHDDYVSIRFAWTMLAIIFVSMVVLSQYDAE